MAKSWKTFVYLLLSLAVVAFLLGCTRGFEQATSTGKISITVKVNVLSLSTNSLKDFEPRIATFVEDLAKVVLTVKDQSGQQVYRAEKTEKKDIQFSFELEKPGNYTFLVEGLYADNNKLFSGQVTKAVFVGQNNEVVIDATFELGTLRTTVEIDETVWQRYNVEFAQLAYKKDTSTAEEQVSPNINERITVHEKQVTPGMWNVKFNIKLKAKDQWTTPVDWQPQTPPSVSVPVKPSKVRNVKFVVRFNSERNEPEIVPVLVSLELPFIEPVQNLSAVWNKNQQKLTITWNHSENATFYVYKEIEEVSGSESYQYYELAGTTTNKMFEIANYTDEEHNRISGIAVNAVVNGKESGLVVLKKSLFSEFTVSVGKVENLAANYDGSNLKITWTYQQTADKYRVYKKIGTADYVFVAEVTSQEANIVLPEEEYNSLTEVAVSVVYSNVEGEKQILSKNSILPFDGGNGTEASPYLIRTAWQLQRLNDDAYRNKGYYFKLTADIDLSGRSWTPIGNYSSNLADSAFVGTLDGNNKKISKLTFDNTSRQNAGLFGYLFQATVKNLIIEDFNVRALAYVGALVGTARKATILRVGVRNSTVTATSSTTSPYPYVGGLIGDTGGGVTIEECFASGVTVDAPNQDNARAGVLVGRLMHSSDGDNVVRKSYAIGILKFKSTSASNIGGLIGLTSSASGSTAKNYIEQCYAAVAPQPTGASNWRGFVGGGSVVAEDPTIMNYFDTNVSQTNSGSAKATLQTGKTTAEMKQQSTFVGWDFVNVWKINEGNDYPRLRWEP